MTRAAALGLLFWGLACPLGARAFGIFGPPTLAGGVRWDAAPRTVGGVERSLDGGLRYALQGGSYQAFRDTFTWGMGIPSVDAFQAAVDGAFAQWLVTDPATGFGTDLSFVPDFATPAIRSTSLGAEIDLFGSNDGSNWDPGQGGPIWGETYYETVPTNRGMTLTSGTTGYAGSAIAGVDIVLNTNTVWNLPTFTTLLAHEIGHALGLADVDYSGPNGLYIDDNYDGTSTETARATLSNSFASLIDPYDPSASPLRFYRVPDADPGIDSAVMLMQSWLPLILYYTDPKLRNDDFAGRQFLYPFVIPEPAALPLVGLGLVGLAAIRRRDGARSGARPDLRGAMAVEVEAA